MSNHQKQPPLKDTSTENELNVSNWRAAKENACTSYNIHNATPASGSGNGSNFRIISSKEQDLLPIFEAISGKFPIISQQLKQWICDNFLHTTSEELLSHDKFNFMLDAEKEKLSELIDVYRDLENVEEESDSSNQSSLSDDDAETASRCSSSLSEKDCDTSSQFSSVPFPDQTKENDGPVLPLEKRMNAKVYPLITCYTQKQEFKRVEQRITREEFFVELCNSTVDGELLYYDESNRPVIKFETLRNYKLNLIGVLGRKNKALKYFKSFLTVASLQNVEQTLKREKSGLYLIVAPVLEPCQVAEAYLYFNSEHDADYRSMNSESRAIHFMRYMTDLTRNILLLLDGSDEKMLRSQPIKVSDVEDRIQELNFCYQEEDKEDIIETSEAEVSLSGKFKEEDYSLFGSNNGLAVARIKKSKTLQKRSLSVKVLFSCNHGALAGIEKFFKGDKSCETKKIKIPGHRCKIVKIFHTNCNKLLVVWNSKDGPFFAVFFDENQKIQSERLRNQISYCDFNPNSRLLCLVPEEEKDMFVIVYRFAKDYRSWNELKCIDVGEINGVTSASLQGSAHFIWLVVNQGRNLMKVNLKTGTECETDWINRDLLNDRTIQSIVFSSSGKRAILKLSDGSIYASASEKSQWQKLKLDYHTSHFFGFGGQSDIIYAAKLLHQKLHINKIHFKGGSEMLSLEDTDDQSCQNSYEQHRHWLHNFIPLYHKFPCEDKTTEISIPIYFVILHEDTGSTIQDGITATFEQIEEAIKESEKQVCIFKDNNFACIDWNTFISKDSTLPFKDTSQKTMDIFIQTVVALIPLQIVRCSSNKLFVLSKGDPIPTDDVRNVHEMKDKISLGLVEAIIRNWTGPIKVVSTMGKQTTGKSYLLNHLFGSSFDISGARCTDGCWMVVLREAQCLYIVLDFEGLGSFERTDQDDMLLSLFNSALSTVTLFKSEKVFDRATDRLFCKFNAGSKQLKGLSNSFTGKFVMIINDVFDKDTSQVKSEFNEKIDMFVKRDSKKCFLDNLYKGAQLRTFAMFGSKKFFKCIEEVRQTILKIEPKHHNGQLFLDTMKLLMAKLSIDDFTPFEKQFVQSRILYLQKHLSGAIKYGAIVLEDNNSRFALTNLDQPGKEIDINWTYDVNISGPQCLALIDNYELTPGGISEAVSFFSKTFTLTPKTAYEWRSSLEDFISAVVNTRFSRVERWLQENLSFWENQKVEDYNDSIAVMQSSYEHEKSTSLQIFKICGEKCSECYLKCTLLGNHSESHNCGTTHNCLETCSYCQDNKSHCHKMFGHENNHNCGDTGHTCGKECSFSTKNQCKFRCSKPPDHEGEHACDLSIHTCIKNCSHPDCRSRCFVECSQPHKIHKCSENTCKYLCSVRFCKKKCVAQNHFHGNLKLSTGFQNENPSERIPPFHKEGILEDIDDHFCGQEHSCRKKCEHEGYCSLSREAFEREEFAGLKSTFTYEKKLVSVGFKDRCLVKIPPFKIKHDSKHFCSLSKAKVHTCSAKCKQCSNLCTKPHNHAETGDKLHNTSHGNMINYQFLSTSLNPIVYENKEYVAGDSCKPFYCHILCNLNGRGHIHVTDCPGECEKKFSIIKDRRRHTTQKFLPDEGEQELDLVWHKQYWENVMGFEDPCSAAESSEFNKCPCECGNEIHDKDNPSYCILDLWHSEKHMLQCKHYNHL